MKIIIILILFIAGAPVFSGASARNKGGASPPEAKADSIASGDPIDSTGTESISSFDFSLLVKAIANADAVGKSSPKNEVPLPKKVENTVTDNTGSILANLIREVRKDKGSNKAKEFSSSSVLDFMTNVYAEHGFYQSGNWDDAEDFSYITRNIILPDYDPADFYRPVWGRVTSTYGYRSSFKRMHKGIDLSLSIGDTVRAALPGVIAKVGYDARGYGHYVVMVHNNGMETRYAHLLAPTSLPGESVRAGDPIGLGGNSGNSTGPHLHFEVRYRGTAIDPASLFNFHILPKNSDNPPK